VRAETNFDFEKKEAVAKLENEKKKEAVSKAESKSKSYFVFSVAGCLF